MVEKIKNKNREKEEKKRRDRNFRISLRPLGVSDRKKSMESHH